MKIKLIAVSAVLGLAQAAAAGTVLETLIAVNRGPQAGPAAVSAPSRAAAGQKTAPALLGAVMTAMYDQPGTGEMLVEWLRANEAAVELRDLGAEASAHAWQGSTPAVYVSPAAMEPVSYRYAGILVARETAELMLKDFPESAEKRYVVASRLSETFFELGGTRSEMGNIDGHSDAKVEESIRLWVENDPYGGASVLAQRGHKTLNDLEKELSAEYNRLLLLEQAIDQMLSVPGDAYAPILQAEMEQALVDASAVRVKLEAVKTAKAAFARFAKEETSWFWEHQGSLQ